MTVYPIASFRPSILPILILLPLFLTWSCGSDTSSPKQQEEMLPDSVNTDGMASPEFLIDSKGLSFVLLGMPLNEMDTIVPDMGILQDTLVYDQGYFLATRTLHLDDGVVVVEGEYIDEEIVNDTLIAESSVNRVRVESPSFRTTDGLAVGMSIGDLKHRFPGEQFYINPIIGYDALDITGAFDTHIHYLVSDPDNQLARNAGPEMSLDDLPQDESLIAIVLMR